MAWRRFGAGARHVQEMRGARIIAFFGNLGLAGFVPQGEDRNTAIFAQCRQFGDGGQSGFLGSPHIDNCNQRIGRQEPRLQIARSPGRADPPAKTGDFGCQRITVVKRHQKQVFEALGTGFYEFRLAYRWQISPQLRVSTREQDAVPYLIP